jgi:uncharacterized protein (DUF2267 family)
LATNITSFDHAVQTTILWLNDIETEMDAKDDKDRAYRATKAVLHAIRDRLPYEALFHFAANLPMIMKGMLFDGYEPKNKPIKVRSVEDFYDVIQENYDAQNREMINADFALQAVVNVLFRRMGPEMRKVAANMPEKIAPLFEEKPMENIT